MPSNTTPSTAANGNFAEIYEGYAESLYRFIFYRVYHKETAEDLLSVTFMKALQNFQSFDPKKGSISSWLYRIARNTVIDYARVKKAEFNIDDMPYLSTPLNLEKQTEDRLRLEKIKKYLEELEPKQKEIVILRLWDGLTHQEIADITGNTLEAVKMAFSRAMKKVRAVATLAIILIMILIKF